MKTSILFFIVALFSMSVFAGTADSLKIDFCTSPTNTASGYEAYLCYNKVPDNFVPTDYEAFGVNSLSLAVSFSGEASPNEVRIVTRDAETVNNADMLKDWLAADGRSSTDQNVVMTLSGLPAGTYTWTSYHHDNAGLVPQFDMTFTQNTTTATVTGTQVSAGTNAPATVVHVFDANGTDDIIITLITPGNDFGLINGFTLAKGGTISTLPVVATPIVKMFFSEVNMNKELDLNSVFTSPNDSKLTYEIASINAASVTSQTISNGTANITALAFGNDTIAVKATDEASQEVSDTFIVEVKEAFKATVVESFDYVAGEELIDFDKDNGGQVLPETNGLLTGSWFRKHTIDGTTTISAESLTYPGMQSHGGAVAFATEGTGKRIYAYYKYDTTNDIFAEGNTVWYSLLMQYNSTDSITNQEHFFKPVDAEVGTGVENVSAGIQSNTNIKVVNKDISDSLIVSGKTYLLMTKFEMSAGRMAKATYWINPDLSSEPTEATAWYTQDVTNAMPAEPVMLIKSAYQDNGSVIFDEIRISTVSYIDTVTTPNDTVVSPPIDSTGNWINENLSVEKEILIYPNPCTSDITVEYNSVSKGRTIISVFQLDGKKVYSTLVNSQIGVNTSTLKLDLIGGYYIVDITNDGKSQSQNLIVN